MKITQKQLVAGYPSIQVRNFLRRFRSAVISASTVQNALKLSPAEATGFLRRMVRLGLLEPSKVFSTKGRPAYKVSTPGQVLANATAAKPLTRKTANRALQEFMDRVQVINAGDEYLYKVESVVLFGSMLSDKERLGDVDLAIELQPVTADNQEFEHQCNIRRFGAQLDGRRFDSDYEWLAWPIVEVFRFLKSRSRTLAMHNLDDLMGMKEVPYRVLHGDPNRLSEMIPGGLPA